MAYEQRRSSAETPADLIGTDHNRRRNNLRYKSNSFMGYSVHTDCDRDQARRDPHPSASSGTQLALVLSDCDKSPCFLRSTLTVSACPLSHAESTSFYELNTSRSGIGVFGLFNLSGRCGCHREDSSASFASDLLHPSTGQALREGQGSQEQTERTEGKSGRRALCCLFSGRRRLDVSLSLAKVCLTVIDGVP